MSQVDASYRDVVIVGGGMVGACMAALLRELPLRIMLVDRQPFDGAAIPCAQPQPAFDARVSALTAASQQLFRDLGAWQWIEELRSCPYQEMEVWDADGTGSVHFDAADIGQPELGTIVENSVINQALYRLLAGQDNLEIVAPANLESISIDQADGQALASLELEDGSALSSGLLIAADGANSRVRQLLNFRTREWDYQQQAIVCTVRTTRPHRYTARQRFIDSGPLAFLPLLPAAGAADQHYSSIVWSAVPPRAEALMELEDDDFRRELAANIEHRLGAIEWSDTRHAFPLRQRHAIDYFSDNAVLIGDAAHTIHPLAGQGVNLGFLDAVALAEELGRGLQAGRPLADPMVLARYQRRRMGHNLGMMGLMEGFKHLFAGQSLPLRWLRNMGMNGVDQLPLLKNQLARRAMGLDW